MIALTIVSIVLMLLGAAGIRLAMTSPVQLQPLPAIAFILGLLIGVFTLGGWLL